MLNRRNLRIKAMQTLFGFQQVRSSNRQIALEKFKEKISSSEEEATSTVEELEQIFTKHLDQSENKSNEFPAQHRDLIHHEISLYQQQTSNDLKYLRLQMVNEVEGIHKMFIWVIGLIIAISDYEGRLIAKRKSFSQALKTGHFENMKSIQLLKRATASEDITSWKDHQDRVSQWYKEIKNSPELLNEFDGSTGSLEDELKKWRYIFKTVLWKSESFQNFFEEYDRGWVENKDIIKSMVNKTLKSVTEDGVVLAPLSYQWEDDKRFFEDLFDLTIKEEPRSEKLIADCAKNWKTDRIAQVDMALLKMALTEMINFPSIPVKVTINEYIELSKKYSTPKSKKFINGILDVLANDLTANGSIKKSGRGLIDNK